MKKGEKQLSFSPFFVVPGLTTFLTSGNNDLL